MRRPGSPYRAEGRPRPVQAAKLVVLVGKPTLPRRERKTMLNYAENRAFESVSQIQCADVLNDVRSTFVE